MESIPAGSEGAADEREQRRHELITFARELVEGGERFEFPVLNRRNTTV
jgi:hypothetical protein